ncbi:MAG: bifunctional DNA-formamidopyrimidine glycosylase/DNA-(apurinic or apyrimidinic site) lyase [Candidatus Binatia bacterium]
MPELPEVETIRRGLDARLRGLTIRGVEVREPRLRRTIDVAALSALSGRRVEAVARRAKYLLVDVGGGWVWLIHLGMSGRLLVLPEGTPAAAHEHVRVDLEGELVLCYRDPRRFGLMRVGRLEEFAELRGLGPEPLDGRLAATLTSRLRATRRDIKAALLDQRLVAGIGNIYANEILFRAGIRPTRRCFRLTRDEIDAISRATRAVLRAAIHRRGTSFSDYFDSDGIPGTFQQRLRVFDRAGEPCRRCGATVKRRAHGGRSSFYCPRCQV